MTAAWWKTWPEPGASAGQINPLPLRERVAAEGRRVRGQSNTNPESFPLTRRAAHGCPLPQGERAVLVACAPGPEEWLPMRAGWVGGFPHRGLDVFDRWHLMLLAGHRLAIHLDGELAPGPVDHLDVVVRLLPQLIRHTGGVLLDGASDRAPSDCDVLHDARSFLHSSHTPP